MILITVGTQLSFDRLIRMMDEIAPLLDTSVFAQTGKGEYQPANMEWSALIGPVQFDELFRKASVVVSHAGIGTFLAAQKYGKPIIMVPRKATLGEHRNEHQSATADALKGRQGVYVAETQDELRALLSQPLEPASADVIPPGRVRLNAALADFIRAS